MFLNFHYLLLLVLNCHKRSLRQPTAVLHYSAVLWKLLNSVMLPSVLASTVS